MPLLLADGARTMKDFAPLVDKKADRAAVLDALKQVALYTDCLGERHWSKPEEVIEPELPRVLIEIAERMIGDRTVTAREVELWCEIVAPHYAKREMAEAVIRCEEALKKEGLKDTAIEGLRSFMEGQPIKVDLGRGNPERGSRGKAAPESE